VPAPPSTASTTWVIPETVSGPRRPGRRHPAQVALAWLLANDDDIAPIHRERFVVQVDNSERKYRAGD
jgi:aryl-alcohol dehydrogenase-like predicted oxidoreductase